MEQDEGGSEKGRKIGLYLQLFFQFLPAQQLPIPATGRQQIGVDMRTAAQITAIRRVGEAARTRGIYP